MVFDSTGATEGIVRASSPDVGPVSMVQVIADGDSYYSRPDQSALPQRRRKWLGFGYAVGEEADEGDFVGTDTALELEALADATDVAAAGTGKVRGVETTRYSGQAPGLGRVEVWIDGDERIRRLRVDGSKVKEGKAQKVTAMTADFFDFGAVPTITLPARQEVLSPPEFQKVELEMQGY